MDRDSDLDRVAPHVRREKPMLGAPREMNWVPLREMNRVPLRGGSATS